MILIKKKDNFRKIRFDFNDKFDYESKRMFCSRVANYIFLNYKKDMYIDIKTLSKKVKDINIIFIILRELMFKTEIVSFKTNYKKSEMKIFLPNDKLYKDFFIKLNVLNKVRELQDLPQNILSPNEFKNKIISEFKDNVKTPLQKDLENMNLFNSIGMSSNNKHEFLIVENIFKNNEDPIVLIGKGITYDSGGYNLKNGKNLLGMKADMSGSAIIFGVMKLLKDLKIKKNVVALLPLADNLLGSNSIQPQTVLKSFLETTVEIKNTDAEGRLILADAIAYSKKEYNPKIIIEVSTLTGAITSFLDNLSSGLFTNNYELGKKFIKLTKKTGEKFILFRRFKEVIFRLYNSSTIADIANYDMNPKMSSLYAFEFLNHFAKDSDFIHIDVAGTAVKNRDRGTAESTISIFEFIKKHTFS